MAFTSVDHDGESDSDPETKGDSGSCAFRHYDLIEVRGGHRG